MNFEFRAGEIRNLIFDLGGVLLNVDYGKTQAAFERLGLRDFDRIYSQAKQEGFFDSFERGELDKQTFIGELRNKLPSDTTDLSIAEAWNAMLGEFPGSRYQMLKDLSMKYRLFLISNTNEIHFEAFNALFDRAYRTSLSVLFEKDYYSHRIGIRKPDPEIFELVLHENDLDASQTLFIDDSIQHVNGARMVKLKTIHLEPEGEVSDLLRMAGILT